MNINITIDFPAIVSNAVSAERLQPILDKAIGEAIKEAINDATGYNSDFRKALKKQLGEAMPHGLAVGDVAKFQHVLNAALTRSVEEQNAATINTALSKAATAALPDVPERMALSYLLREARGYFGKSEHEGFYAHFEPSEYIEGTGWLYLDQNERPGSTFSSRSYETARDRRYQASISLAINKQGEVYALKLGGVDVMPNRAPEAIGRFEGLLLSMYVGRTTVDLDIDGEEVWHFAEAKEY